MNKDLPEDRRHGDDNDYLSSLHLQVITDCIYKWRETEMSSSEAAMNKQKEDQEAQRSRYR